MYGECFSKLDRLKVFLNVTITTTISGMFDEAVSEVTWLSVTQRVQR